MEIKFFKKSLSIIIIMTIIIASMMISKSEAVETLASGKTLLHYVDVDVVPEKGKKLKIMLPNYDKKVMAKVKILQTGKELKIKQDKTSKKHYVTYTGDARKITLEFYKKDAQKPYVSKQMEIKKEQDGTYSAIRAPKITYSTESDNDRAFKITDAKGISEIVICKRNAKDVYDYKEENIIYKNNIKGESKINNQYVNTQPEKLGTKAPIKIKRLDEYGYYEIKVTGISGLMHTREVKVRGKMKTAKPTAKTENGFAPSIKVDKSNKDKVTFKIDKANKVTSAKMYQVIDGKVNSKKVKLDVDKTGNYITSFTFAKEGMYRLKLLNKSGESAASITDFIINRKNNTETWRVNESPRVVKSTGEKNIQKIKISDGAIKSVKIFVKGSKGYDLTKPIYKYENGQVKKTTAKYIDESKSSYKNKNNIYIALKRSTSATTKYLIQVTDHGGNDPELIKNRMIHVEKVATTKTKKPSKGNGGNGGSSGSTESSNPSKKKTVKKNSSPTLNYNKKTKVLTVYDKDGIKDVKFYPDSFYLVDSTKDGRKGFYKPIENKYINADVYAIVTDNSTEHKKEKTNTKHVYQKSETSSGDATIKVKDKYNIYIYDKHKIEKVEIVNGSGYQLTGKYNLKKTKYTFYKIHQKMSNGTIIEVKVTDCNNNVTVKKFTKNKNGMLYQLLKK